MQIFQGELRVDVSALLLAQQAAIAAGAAAAEAGKLKLPPYQPFETRGAAQAAAIQPDIQYLAVGDLRYVRDPAGTALTTADGAKWSPLGTASSEHWGGGDADRINAAISWVFANGGGEVQVPFGFYVLTDTVNMQTNVTVRAAPGTIIDASGVTGDAMWFGGTADAEINLTANAGVGTEEINATGAGFQVGDLIHLVGQRNALSRTDAQDYWLGDGTSGAPRAYFAEFATVVDFELSTYRLSRKLTFPAYFTNANQETESLRDRAKVKRVTPVRNAHWIGGTVVKMAGGSTVFDSMWAADCTVQDVKIEMGSRAGQAVRWRSSLDCEGRNVECVNDPGVVWDYGTMHGGMNRFMVVGSQDCGFDGCRTTHAAQAVDFSYADFGGGDGPFVNLRPYCRNGKFRSCFEGLTSHPGSYEEEWFKNQVIDCFEDGLLVRGMRPRITGNTFQRSFDAAPSGPDYYIVGVGLSYGGYRGARVTGNSFSGYPVAVSMLDSATEEWQARDVDVVIADNDIDNCYTGLRTELRAWNGIRGITYIRNRHTRMGRYMVLLNSYTAGIDITDNVVVGDFLNTTAFVALAYIGNNNPAVTFKNNRWLRSKGGNSGQNKYRAYWLGITDEATYPAADYQSQSVISGNTANYSSELMADFFGSSAYPVT